MTDVINGISKEPDEIEYKPIDIETNWLSEDEELTDLSVYAYEITDTTIKEFDLDNIEYLSITTHDSNHNIVNEESEWRMADDWTHAIFSVLSEQEKNEVTEDIVVDETGSESPNNWIDQITNGKFRVGIKGGKVGDRYHVKIKFSTSANRTKILHFPVNIIEVLNI